MRRNYAKIDHINGKIIMDKEFFENSSILGSKEYNLLHSAKKEYTDYEIEIKQCKKNPNQIHYGKLSYEYMEEYIRTFEPVETIPLALAAFHAHQLKSDDNKKSRYPAVKHWFIERYPAIKDYGALPIEDMIRIQRPNRLTGLIIIKKGA